MSDAVFDTTVVACANSDIAARRAGNSLDRRLHLLEIAGCGQVRVRYNRKLLSEYQAHIKTRRNDVIELFFAVLDSAWAIRVTRSTLSRQDYRLAVEQRWPTHDQHLLAAALGGDRPCVYVTEPRLATCGLGIQRVFNIRVRRV